MTCIIAWGVEGWGVGAEISSPDELARPSTSTSPP